MNGMKAITVFQPYAHWICIGDKRIENRTWRTPYCGPLMIHAGVDRGWIPEGLDVSALPFGAVVAVADLVEVVAVDEVDVGRFGLEHAYGPICWCLANVRALRTPVPALGPCRAKTAARGRHVRGAARGSARA